MMWFERNNEKEFFDIGGEIISSLKLYTHLLIYIYIIHFTCRLNIFTHAKDVKNISGFSVYMKYQATVLDIVLQCKKYIQVIDIGEVLGIIFVLQCTSVGVWIHFVYLVGWSICTIKLCMYIGSYYIHIPIKPYIILHNKNINKNKIYKHTTNTVTVSVKTKESNSNYKITKI